MNEMILFPDYFPDSLHKNFRVAAASSVRDKT